MSLALARRPDGLLSSDFQVQAQRVSIARSGQRVWAGAETSKDSTLAAWFLSRVCHSTSVDFPSQNLVKNRQYRDTVLLMSEQSIPGVAVS